LTREHIIMSRECDAVASHGGVDVTSADLSNSEAERIDGFKVALTHLFSLEAELDAELNELHKRHAINLRELRAKRDGVLAEIKAAKSELDAAVNAPVSGDRDPTESLPDELIVMIIMMLPFATLRSGACKRVCRRWNALIESAPIVRRRRDERWAALEAGAIKQHVVDGHTSAVVALAIGSDGRVYSASEDRTIRIWSGESGAHLQTLTGHTDVLRALAIGSNGKIYSGSYDKTIRVWSSASGAHMQTLTGHTHLVIALAVGLDGKVYSGSSDRTIRVWSGDDGSHLKTLVGHTGAVYALAIGKNGIVYSGSRDTTVMAWSGEDGTHLRTLAGHSQFVLSLAVGLDGKVYSGSGDFTVRVWSPHDGALLQTLRGHKYFVRTLAVASDGKLFSGSDDLTIMVWSGETGAHLHTLVAGPQIINQGRRAAHVRSLAFGRDDVLYSGHFNGAISTWR
jgi:WD40 repeat protein